MTGKELKLAILGLIAAIAAGLGIKYGQRKADKRVEKVAGEAVERMEVKRREDTKEKLDAIDDRPRTDDALADLEARLGTRPGDPD